MTVLWPKTTYVKIHEGCGGIVAWREAIGRPSVHFTGECDTCTCDDIVQESIIPIEVGSDEDYRRQIMELPSSERRELDWDEDDTFRHNQKQIAESIQ